jgi:hypothetical protein
MLEARHYGKHGRERRATDLASSWKFVLNFGLDAFWSHLAGGVDIAVSVVRTVH